MDSIHQGHRERLRKRFIKNGLESFAPHEVLELLLFSTIPRRDTNPVAHNLMDKYGGDISKVFKADIDDLKTVSGVGDSSAFLIHLIPELIRYVNLSEMQTERSLGTTEKLGEFAVNLCGGRKEESLFVICLDSNKNLKDYKLLEEGGVNHVNFDIRKIAEYAMKQQAVRIVLVHNHPNGSCLPSSADKKNTMSALVDLSKFDINIDDHIIVSQERYYSMKEMGDLELF